jgi:hypothetical protein
MGWIAPRFFAVWSLFVLSSVALAETAPESPPPECWDGPRDYYPDGEGATGGVKKVEERVHMDHVRQALPEPMVVSPNRAYAYHLEVSPAGPASRASRVELLVFVERPYLVRFVAGDVFNAIDDHWVSGKLLYLRVALGRISFLDLILDVERERIVYREAGDFGDLVYQQAKASCATAEVGPSCAKECYRLNPKSPAGRGD